MSQSYRVSFFKKLVDSTGHPIAMHARLSSTFVRVIGSAP